MRRWSGSESGDVAGHSGPGSTHTPMTLIRATIQGGTWLQLPWNARYNAMAYILAGSGRAGAGLRPVQTGDLLYSVQVTGSAYVPTTVKAHERQLGAARPRRGTDPRTGRTLWAVRDEHQG